MFVCLSFCEVRPSKVVCGLLCLVSDMAAVFQSVCVIMRPQGAENSGTLTWREEEHSEAEWVWGDKDALIPLFCH